MVTVSVPLLVKVCSQYELEPDKSKPDSVPPEAWSGVHVLLDWLQVVPEQENEHEPP